MPSASVGSTRPQRGGACQGAGKDTATGPRGETGDPTCAGRVHWNRARRGLVGRRGHGSAPPRPARDDAGGQEVAKPATDGAAVGPEARHTPGEQQTGRGLRRTDRERGTDGVRPPEAKATEPAVEVGVGGQPPREDGLHPPGEASRPPGRTADPTGGLPAQGRPGTPGTATGARSRGSRHRHLLTQSRSRPGETLSSRRVPAVPQGPHIAQPCCARPPPRPLSQGLEGTALLGTRPGGRRRGDDTT